jgi:hypothetical protein
MTELKTHKAGRIDQIVRDYFNDNPTIKEIRAKDLMPIFINKEIFTKDYRNGLPIRKFLRELDDENKLNLLKNIKVIKKDKNRNWYFIN